MELKYSKQTETTAVMVVENHVSPSAFQNYANTEVRTLTTVGVSLLLVFVLVDGFCFGLVFL